MDVIQLHYFRTIVEQGSLNKATEGIFVLRSRQILMEKSMSVRNQPKKGLMFRHGGICSTEAASRW